METTHTPSLDLAAIQAQLDALTPGLRVVRPSLEYPQHRAYITVGDGDMIQFNTQHAVADATFYVAAPAHIAALQAELARVRALIEDIYPIDHDELCQLRAEWRLPYEERRCTCHADRENTALEAALGRP